VPAHTASLACGGLQTWLPRVPSRRASGVPSRRCALGTGREREAAALPAVRLWLWPLLRQAGRHADLYSMGTGERQAPCAVRVSLPCCCRSQRGCSRLCRLVARACGMGDSDAEFCSNTARSEATWMQCMSTRLQPACADSAVSQVCTPGRADPPGPALPWSQVPMRLRPRARPLAWSPSGRPPRSHSPRRLATQDNSTDSTQR